MAWIIELCLYFLYLTIVNTVQNESKFSKSRTEDRCFCELKGEVDDCSCKVELIDSFNNAKIYPTLQSLLIKDYFKYFKSWFDERAEFSPPSRRLLQCCVTSLSTEEAAEMVTIALLFQQTNSEKKSCPFWADDVRCALKDCHVDNCEEEDLPDAFRDEAPEKKYLKNSQDSESCKEELELSALDTTISETSKEAFKNWTLYDDAQETFCEFDDENSSDMQYVNLLLNPERYTGYKGPSAHRVWNSIYEENCFQPDPGIGYGTSQSLSGLCLEKRTFYRMISGLHTSINLHLSALYLMPGKSDYGQVGGTWGPNIKEFKGRFDPETTNNQGPQRLKNLYFAYLVELRALAKAAPYLEQESFFTGSRTSDDDVKQGITELLKIIKSFPDQFDESKLFVGNHDEAKKLQQEFRSHFRNISKIMDCVGCEKCRLWGKVQIQGMGTALKILFSGDSIGPHSTISAGQKSNFQLRREEIVALINAFGRLSSSIHHLEIFKKLLR